MYCLVLVMSNPSFTVPPASYNRLIFCNLVFSKREMVTLLKALNQTTTCKLQLRPKLSGHDDVLVRNGA